MAFSVERFEWLVHRHRNEEAARELIELVQHLDRSFGRFPDLEEALYTGRQDPRSVAYVTRVAAAIASLFSDATFQLTEDGFRQFSMAHRWLSAIFGASAFGTADHVLRALAAESNDGTGGGTATFAVEEKDLLKFALLYSIDSTLPLDIESLWNKNRKIAACLFLGILSSRIVLSDAAHEKREKLLEWFPQKLRTLTLPDIPAGFLHDVWMHCTYAATPTRHDIKGVLNGMVRDELLRAGYEDDLRPRPAGRDRPVIVVVTDHFHSKHAVFRWFSRLVGALRPAFRVVGVGVQKPDEAVLSLFDRHVLTEMTPDWRLADALQKMTAAIREELPDIVFYLGIGMSLQGIFLSNLRLAPVQVSSWGHPASSRSAQIDYFLLEEYYRETTADFSEKILLLPDNAFPSAPLWKPEFTRGVRKDDGVVNVAIVLSLMKLNPVFLRACRQIVERSRVPLRLHFMLGGCHGVTTMYVDNLIRRFVPDVVVYPQMPQELYYQALSAADMCLDPFPFGNQTSLVDYASEGLPTICLYGDQMFSRMGALSMRRLGLPEGLVAHSVEEYVSKAVELAADKDRRSAIKAYLLDVFRPGRVENLPVFNGDPDAVCRALLGLVRPQAAVTGRRSGEVAA